MELIFLITALKYKSFAFINEKLVRFRAHSSSITINSGNGKLLLMYAVAKTYFLENYMQDNVELIKRFNGEIKILLLQYDAKQFKLNSIEDFYIKNTNYNFSIIIYIQVMKQIVKRIIKKIIGRK